jgi:hypothetical protein
MTSEQTDSLAQTTKQSVRVTPENFKQVWSYILAEIESGRWTFADWPLENLQEIPLNPDPDGKAIQDLDEWINRHLKVETQEKMYTTIKSNGDVETDQPVEKPVEKPKITAATKKTAAKPKSPPKAKKAAKKTAAKPKSPPNTKKSIAISKREFEAKKAASEIILSEKTRNRLLEYRGQMFGEGKGSMELAIRQLLDGVERTLPLDTFQKLTAFQRQNDLSNLDNALSKLFELTEKSDEAPIDSISPADTILIKEEIQQLLSELKSDS